MEKKEHKTLKVSSMISYIVSLVAYVYAGVLFYLGDKSTAVVWVCLGSTFLCCGSIFGKIVDEHLESVVIREEQEEDYAKTELMVMRAFWNQHIPGCCEHLLVRNIRTSKEYVPSISRVAELDGKIVGAVYYTKAVVVCDDGKEEEVLCLGPLAVEPTIQGIGIGKKLVDTTLELAKNEGFQGVVLIGEENYYPKFGFAPTTEFGISDKDGNFYDPLQALALNDSFKNIHGKFVEANVYEEADDPKKLQEIAKEFPAYPKYKFEEGFWILGGKQIAKVHDIIGEEYILEFWEKEINAHLVKELKADVEKHPNRGDVVLFDYNKKGESFIVKKCDLLDLED